MLFQTHILNSIAQRLKFLDPGVFWASWDLLHFLPSSSAIQIEDVITFKAGKMDDPQGGDTTMLMQQVREVMTVNQEMTDESRWI